MVEISDFRYPVTLEKPNPNLTKDAYGQENLASGNWVVDFQDRAAIMSLNSREFFQGDQLRADCTHKVYIRFSSNSVKVTPKHRIRWNDLQGTRYLQVVQRFDSESGRRRVTTLICKETL